MVKNKLEVKITWNKDGSICIIPSNQKAMEKYTQQISGLAFKLLDDFMKDMYKKAKKIKKLKLNKRSKGTNGN